MNGCPRRVFFGSVCIAIRLGKQQNSINRSEANTGHCEFFRNGSQNSSTRIYQCPEFLSFFLRYVLCTEDLDLCSQAHRQMKRRNPGRSTQQDYR